MLALRRYLTGWRRYAGLVINEALRDWPYDRGFVEGARAERDKLVRYLRRQSHNLALPAHERAWYGALSNRVAGGVHHKTFV